jgi:hypothetical protein
MSNKTNVTFILPPQSYEQRFPDWPSGFIPPRLIDPDYIAPNRSHGPIAFILFSVAITTIIVSLRISVRIASAPNSIWWDDFAAALGMLVFWGFVSTQLLLCYIGGVGVHSYDLSLQTLVLSLKVTLPLFLATLSLQ